MAANNAPTVTSGQVALTSRADINTSAAAAFGTGGAVDDSSSYSVQDCQSGVADSATYGQLAIAAGSTMVATLPAGAVLVDAGGGSYVDNPGTTPDTVSWTLPLRTGGCDTRNLLVRYPSSDPANTVGATKTLNVVWGGSKYGQSTVAQLGSATATHTLTGAGYSSSLSKTVQTPRASDTTTHLPTVAVGEGLTYSLGAQNNGTSTWDSVTVNDPVPAPVKVTSLTAFSNANAGYAAAAGITGDASVWISSVRGPDGILGNADDGTLVKAADVPAGSRVTVDPYAATLPSGAAGLVSGDFVTAVEVHDFGVLPGTGGTVVAVAGTVLSTGRDAVASTPGLQFTNTASFAITSAAGNGTSTRSATAEIDVAPAPVPGVTVRNAGGGTLVGAGRVGSFTLSGDFWGDDTTNPVFVLELPAKTSLVSWAVGNSPAATLTTIADWDGAGSTLERFTWPVGTVFAHGTGHQINYSVQLDKGNYVSNTIKGWVSSTTEVPACGDNYFDGSPDAHDRDADGNTTEVMCPWFAGLAPAPSSSALLVQSVKGSWDTGFVDGPGSGYTTPGHDDDHLLSVESTATIAMDQADVIDILPRPGDSAVSSGAQRNPATSTFPVYLRARPTVPSLGTPVVTYWTTAVNPCRPELSYSPSGCTAAAWVNWSTTAPSSLTAVTAVKFDFTSNRLAPGAEWDVDLPVTTPASGATEPDFAVVNPDPSAPEADEIAWNSSGFVIRRTDLPAMLLPSEAQAVGLRMPSIYGPIGAPPTAAALTSSGTGVAGQDTTAAVPAHGSATLLDGLTPVASLAVDGVGTYTIDTTTGAVHFAPVLGFAGAAPAVGYRIADVFGQGAISSYVATVVAPTGPSAAQLTSSGIGTAGQSATVAVPDGGSVTLLDGFTPVSSLDLPGIGTYTVSPTGVFSFVPAAGFDGVPPAAQYRISDAYGTTATSTYLPTVAAPAAAVPPDITSSGNQGATQTLHLVVPAGSTVTLVDGSGNPTTLLVVPGEGTYALDTSTGTVTFVPEAAFVGQATPVSYRITDLYNRAAAASLRVTVVAAAVAPPVAPPTAPKPPAVTVRAHVTVSKLAVAGEVKGDLPVGCSVAAGTITRCAVSLYARVSGQDVLIGHGVSVVGGDGTHGVVRVVVTLNALGRALATQPGGTKVRVAVVVHRAHHAGVLTAGGSTRIVAHRFLSPRPVFFDTASWAIRPGDKAYLTKLRHQLAGVKSVQCIGFTDSQDTDAYNLALGRHRAKAVCAFLTHGTGLSAGRITYGEQDPHSTNATPQGRQLNRRVEIRLTY